MARERLQKILSRAGVASRRAAEQMILEGRVEVNGKVVRELGSRADPEVDTIRVDGQPVARVEEKIHLLLYKPPNVVTTLSDPEGRRSVGDLLKSLKVRVFPVGRLDYDAEGALLLTNDGDLAHKLAHPRWGVPRTYRAKVKGFPSEEALERMKRGVRLEDGTARALEVEVERTLLRNAWIRLVVSEGRHHLVKRLCEAVGHPVDRLIRLDYAGVGIEKMEPGDLRFLSPGEVRKLQAAVRKEAPPPPGGVPRRRRRPGAGAVRDPILGAARPHGRPPRKGPRGKRV
jgi:23S rRNA pseudouridine2605 synthase